MQQGSRNSSAITSGRLLLLGLCLTHYLLSLRLDNVGYRSSAYRQYAKLLLFLCFRFLDVVEFTSTA
jgi:hypothetical protein